MPAASELAAEFEALNESVLAFARAASPEDWAQRCSAENWPVSGVIRHIASGYVTTQIWIRGYLGGRPIPIDQDEIDRRNELHAAEYATATVPETVALLVSEGTRAVTLVGGLSEAQLAIAYPVIPGRELTAGQLVKILIRHSRDHLESARSALSNR
ncbi:MAG: DinB family protein [Candidatus Dormibacterales bacterium]